MKFCVDFGLVETRLLLDRTVLIADIPVGRIFSTIISAIVDLYALDAKIGIDEAIAEALASIWIWDTLPREVHSSSIAHSG
jgi:hypothetical protein